MTGKRNKKPLAPLSVAAEALLPGENETPRCSVHALRLDVRPAGTAIEASCVILVETPAPWPKPVFDHPHLSGVGGKLVDPNGNPVRVLAAVPRFGRELSAFAFRRVNGETVASEVPLANRSAAEVVELLRSSQDPRQVAGGIEIDPSAVLVCTQGSHDVCCGSEGTALAAQISGDYRLASTSLFRVSHTGGHRFAPTAMTFPDGRMWAFIDVDQLASIVNQTCEPSEIAQRCRGSWQARSGAAQAAEVAVFGENDWPEGPIGVTELGEDRFRVTRARQSTDSEVCDVLVTVSRGIPVIRCRAAGGLPAKPSSEFATEILTG